MKKYIFLMIFILGLIPTFVFAVELKKIPEFKPATLFLQEDRVAVFSEDEASHYFGLGYKLEENELLGSSITTIQGSDTLKASRTVINDNFTALNEGKIEISTTTLPNITDLENLETVGTITSGIWNATPIDPLYGGTGTTTPTSNQVLLGDGSSGIKVVNGFGSSGQVLESQGDGLPPIWQSGTVDESLAYDWTGEHSWSATTTFNGAVVGVSNFWGNGNDGASTTVANMSLDRDVYYTDLTVNTGVTLNTNGFRIFVSGTLNTVGTGKITSNGNNGGNGGTGSADVQGTAGTAGVIAYSTGTLPIPLVGKAGGVGQVAGNNGTDQAKALVSQDASAGGHGGDGTSNTGEIGGTAGSETGTIYSLPNAPMPAYNLYDLSGATITQYGVSPSSGSGGGGGSNTNYGAGGAGGGGGGGSASSGGVVWIAARAITNLNVEATGGDGGQGGNGTDSSGVGGGGAGGNGGVAILIYSSATTINTTVTGGTGGAFGSSGTQTNAVNGTAGNVGKVYQIQL